MAWLVLGADPAGGGDNQVTQINVAVATGTTETVDTLPLASFHGAVWFITAVDLTGRAAMKEVIGFNSANAPSHAIPAKIGKDVGFTPNVDIDSGNLRLRITNTHTEDFTAKVVRIETRV